MRAALLIASLLLAACKPDLAGGPVPGDGGAFKRPPTPIPAIPVRDDRLTHSGHR